MSVIIIKLGGSVITRKRQYRTFSNDHAEALAKELAWLAEQGYRFLIVHGAGSFGHIGAEKYRLHAGYNSDIPHQLDGFATVSRDVRDLNLRLLNHFIDVELKPVSIPPSAVVTFDNGKMGDIAFESFERYFELGLTPVTFGDGVHDVSRGFAICSGDDLMLELAKRFHAAEVIFLTDVDGVYDPRRLPDEHVLLETLDPALHEQLHASVERGDEVEEGDITRLAPDVTGGIWHKVETGLAIAKLGVRVTIMNGTIASRLSGYLEGSEVPHTRLLAEGSPDA